MRFKTAPILSLVFLPVAVLAPQLLAGGSTASKTTLASSANPSVLSKEITLTATVQSLPAPTVTVQSLSSPTPTPTGTVAFYNGVFLLGKATLVSGQAAIKTVLPTGTWPLKAVYSG